MSDWFLTGDYGTVPTNYAILAISLLLAFVCGHAIAWTYMLTHTGLSYSRSYVGTLIVIPVIVALVMMILANNLVLAFGLMAIFAMVRFRSILRDTLDTAYVLAVIVIGLACGTLKLTSAVIGCVFTVALMIYLWGTNFGARLRHDFLVSLQWRRAATELASVQSVLGRHCRSFECASQRPNEDGDGLALFYRLQLRDPARSHELLENLRDIDGVTRVSGVRAEEESEL